MTETESQADLFSQQLTDSADVLRCVVSAKNRRYGSAYERATACLKILFGDTIPTTPHAMLLLRILDKMCRETTRFTAPLDAESRCSLHDNWLDIAGYALIGLVLAAPQPSNSDISGTLGEVFVPSSQQKGCL